MHRNSLFTDSDVYLFLHNVVKKSAVFTKTEEDKSLHVDVAGHINPIFSELKCSSVVKEWPKYIEKKSCCPRHAKFFTVTELHFSSTGWLSTGQPSSAGVLSHHPLRVWKHSQGLRLQTAVQVPRLLFPIGERVHVREVRMPYMYVQWWWFLGVRGLIKKSVCPQVDGSHPQRHSPLQRRSYPEQQRVASSLSCLVSMHRLPRVLSPWTLLFFPTHIWDICTRVHAHTVLFLML